LGSAWKTGKRPRGVKSRGLLSENLLQQIPHKGCGILPDAGFHLGQPMVGPIGDAAVEIEAQGIGEGKALDQDASAACQLRQARRASRVSASPER
jgi:hypothetical protein